MSFQARLSSDIDVSSAKKEFEWTDSEQVSNKLSYKSSVLQWN
jgi:hypothetical protein